MTSRKTRTRHTNPTGPCGPRRQRGFGIVGVVLLGGLAGGVSGAGEAPSELTLASVERFVATPRVGVRVSGAAFYVRPAGVEMLAYHSEQTQSDKADVSYRRRSNDNGRTWSEPVRVETFTRTDAGTRRRSLLPGFVDPKTGTLLTMILEGVLPGDNPLEGMKHWTLRYALSRDGGRTFHHEAPVVQQGGDFTPEHPLPGVWVGKNAAMIGDTTCVPIRLSTGEILQPVQITPIGPDGEYHNPGGGYTYHDAAVLIGRWNDDRTIDWRLSGLVKGDPARSTRGALEPTIAELPDGRILMVLRGSNDRKPKLPGYRWYAISTDRGRTWSPPEPWTSTEGKPFHSPSSCSQLLTHSNGRLYWIGNVTPTNPRGNLPRHPLVIGEVDRNSGLLMIETLCTIDDRRPDEPARVDISNFYGREDRLTHQIVIHCSPLNRGPVATALPPPHSRRAGFDWTSDAWIYRVDVKIGR